MRSNPPPKPASAAGTEDDRALGIAKQAAVQHQEERDSSRHFESWGNRPTARSGESHSRYARESRDEPRRGTSSNDDKIVRLPGQATVVTDDGSLHRVALTCVSAQVSRLLPEPLLYCRAFSEAATEKASLCVYLYGTNLALSNGFENRKKRVELVEKLSRLLWPWQRPGDRTD